MKKQAPQEIVVPSSRQDPVQLRHYRRPHSSPTRRAATVNGRQIAAYHGLPRPIRPLYHDRILLGASPVVASSFSLSSSLSPLLPVGVSPQLFRHLCCAASPSHFRLLLTVESIVDSRWHRLFFYCP